MEGTRMKAMLLFVLCLIANTALANEYSGTIFDWAMAQLPVKFPQTHVIGKNLETELSRVGFKNEDDYLKYMNGSNGEAVEVTKFIKKHNPELWQEMTTEIQKNNKVLLSVTVDGSVAACKPCSIQGDLLDEKNYFGMTHYKLVMSR
jgi:hypothetical protein